MSNGLSSWVGTAVNLEVAKHLLKGVKLLEQRKKAKKNIGIAGNFGYATALSFWRKVR